MVNYVLWWLKLNLNQLDVHGDFVWMTSLGWSGGQNRHFRDDVICERSLTLSTDKALFYPPYLLSSRPPTNGTHHSQVTSLSDGVRGVTLLGLPPPLNMTSSRSMLLFSINSVWVSIRYLLFYLSFCNIVVKVPSVGASPEEKGKKEMLFLALIPNYESLKRIQLE